MKNKNIDRRNFMKGTAIATGGVMMAGLPVGAEAEPRDPGAGDRRGGLRPARHDHRAARVQEERHHRSHAGRDHGGRQADLRGDAVEGNLWHIGDDDPLEVLRGLGSAEGHHFGQRFRRQGLPSLGRTLRRGDPDL